MSQGSLERAARDEADAIVEERARTLGMRPSLPKTRETRKRAHVGLNPPAPGSNVPGMLALVPSRKIYEIS